MSSQGSDRDSQAELQKKLELLEERYKSLEERLEEEKEGRKGENERYRQEVAFLRDVVKNLAEKEKEIVINNIIRNVSTGRDATAINQGDDSDLAPLPSQPLGIEELLRQFRQAIATSSELTPETKTAVLQQINAIARLLGYN